MAIMYLAKLNVTSKIYEVYNNNLNISNIIDEVFEKLDNSKIYIEEEKRKYVDEFGNKIIYTKKSKYQFAELEKNIENKIITGKVVKNFNRPTEELDKEKNEVTSTYTDEYVSIYFYFDVLRESITFCVRQSFGYNQFTNAFNNLINLTIPGYGFEVFLQKDEDILEEKLKEFKRITKFTATLVPPNSNEEELEELRNTLNYIGDCQESNASKYRLELMDSNENPGLNRQAKIMQDTVTAVTRGYGDLTAIGYNGSDKLQVVKSNQDAALTSVVDDKLTDVDFIKQAKNFIDRFFAKIIQRRSKEA